MVKSEFRNQGDECIVNPKNCPHGLSFSIWEKALYQEDVLQVMNDHEKKYILSTGMGFFRFSPLCTEFDVMPTIFRKQSKYKNILQALNLQ